MRAKAGDLKTAARGRVEAEHKRLKSYQRIVEIAHPKNTMRRGFSVTRTADGRILRSVSQAGVGRDLRVSTTMAPASTTARAGGSTGLLR